MIIYTLKSSFTSINIQLSLLECMMLFIKRFSLCTATNSIELKLKNVFFSIKAENLKIVSDLENIR